VPTLAKRLCTGPILPLMSTEQIIGSPFVKAESVCKQLVPGMMSTAVPRVPKRVKPPVSSLGIPMKAVRNILVAALFGVQRLRIKG
jgi:hypothetical protein